MFHNSFGSRAHEAGGSGKRLRGALGDFAAVLSGLASDQTNRVRFASRAAELRRKQPIAFFEGRQVK
jgi:hypothetical protein